ncbi:MAG: hydroxyacid dehydrogenase [Treponema sp.]|nr:hydroxyacid dehydrogenase [Treponema sp.]
MKFVMTQSVCFEALEMLGGKAEVYVADNGDPVNYPDEMRDADAFVLRLGKIDRSTIENSPKLKVIGKAGVGYETVDIAAATEAGIPVVITPGANNRSVAEHTLAMMLAISKDLVNAHNETGKGNFKEARSSGRSFEVLGKTAGLIGLGSIGAEVARLCRAVGMAVLGFDPFLDKDSIEALGCIFYADYEDMIKECDFVSIHVPLTENTRGMVGKKQLSMMKKTAVLINCSRGGIVDERDLTEALESGIIAAAGIDVFETEPPNPNDPLLAARNLLYSPHSAAQTREAIIRMHTMCIEGCLEVIAGRKYPHTVNKAVYEHPGWSRR